MGGNVRKGENQANGRGALPRSCFLKEYVKKDAEPVRNPRTGELELPLSRRGQRVPRVQRRADRRPAGEVHQGGDRRPAIPEPQAVLDAYLAGNRVRRSPTTSTARRTISPART